MLCQLSRLVQVSAAGIVVTTMPAGGRGSADHENLDAEVPLLESAYSGRKRQPWVRCAAAATIASSRFKDEIAVAAIHSQRAVRRCRLLPG